MRAANTERVVPPRCCPLFTPPLGQMFVQGGDSISTSRFLSPAVSAAVRPSRAAAANQNPKQSATCWGSEEHLHFKDLLRIGQPAAGTQANRSGVHDEPSASVHVRRP